MNENISLRDYFAGLALHAFITKPDAIPLKKRFVECAYEIADSMLKERSKNKEEEE